MKDDLTESISQTPYAWSLAGISETWVIGPYLRHSKTINGQNGMLLYTSWAIDGHQNEEVVAAAYFYDEAGNELPDRDGKYASQRGTVALVTKRVTLPYDRNLAHAYGVFMPYAQLDVTAKGRHRIFVKLRVVSSQTKQVIAESVAWPFILKNP